MKPALFWSCAAAVLLAIAAFGYRRGKDAAADAPANVSAAIDSATPHARENGRSHTAAIAAPVLPAKLDELDGNAFIAAMPELERRARGGDEAATRILISREQQCLNFAPREESDIRRQVEEDYERQLDIQKKFPSAASTFVIDEKWRDDRLREQFDYRDRCEALSPKQRGERFDWAALALSRHDRDAVLQFATFNGLYPDSVERVRYADRLIDLAKQEQLELNRLVEDGDVDAMTRAMTVLSHHDFTLIQQNDPEQSYEIAYALMLDGNPNQWRLDQITANIAKDLSPEQIEAADAAGAALYQRCCAAGQGAGLGSH